MSRPEDYFDSIHRNLRADHVIFQFDQTMGCSEGDRAFIEQIGLCIGVDAAKREASMLISGDQHRSLTLQGVQEFSYSIK